MCTKDRYPGAATYVACSDVTQRFEAVFSQVIEGVRSRDVAPREASQLSIEIRSLNPGFLQACVGASHLIEASAVPTFPCPEDERCLPEADLRCSVWGPPAVQGHLVPAVATSLPSDAGIQ